jgi:hypothetical protein
MVDFEKFLNTEIEIIANRNFFFKLETGFGNIGFLKVQLRVRYQSGNIEIFRFGGFRYKFKPVAFRGISI